MLYAPHTRSTNPAVLFLLLVQVSGEYSMIKAAGALGMVDEQKVMMESLMCRRHPDLLRASSCCGAVRHGAQVVKYSRGPAAIPALHAIV